MRTQYLTESQSAQYSGILKDELGDPVPSTEIQTLTLTFYDYATGDIINGRDHQDALNANDVTMDDYGVVTWVITPEDTGFILPSTSAKRIALFEATWAGGSRFFSWEVMFIIQDVKKLSLHGSPA